MTTYKILGDVIQNLAGTAVELTVVSSIQVVGVVMTSALLVTPAAATAMLTD